MGGIVSYGAYVPYWRLDRMQIAMAMRVPAGKGTRAVASYDEDSTTMGVEAARRALAAAPAGLQPGAVAFSTATPAYLDKTNANTIHAALGLDRSVPAYDMGGAVRSARGAMAFAFFLPVPALAVLSDVRTGLPGGGDEAQGGDGAAAFLYGQGGAAAPVIAEGLGSASATAEFLDRWRVPGENASRVWEERFGEHEYLPLADEAFTEALKAVGLTPAEVDHLIVSGLHGRAGRAFAKSAGVRPEALVDDLSGSIGNAGTAQAGITLASVLDTAAPNAVIVVVTLADGADAVVFRTTDALPAWRESRSESHTVASQIAAGRTDLAYPNFLTWRGMLHREPPRRPDPTPPAAPPSARNESWKFGFVGSSCTECNTRHLPPVRVCVQCGSVDRMTDVRLSDAFGSIATFTVDHLSFSPSPPVVAVVVDFDGGGRLRCNLTDVDPDTVAIGQRVAMTFRLISVANGIHNYFWKARPVREGEE